MNIKIDKAVIYCAKCKTELTWYYAENANYIFFCKNCKSKIIVTARSLRGVADKIKYFSGAKN